MKLTPDAIAVLLKQIQQIEGLVVVGGQAINLWALQSYQPTPEWAELQPFSSVDLDFFGGRLEAVQCADALSGQLTLAKDFDPSPNSGVVMVDVQGHPFRIDILSSVYGLADEEIRKTAMKFIGAGELAGVELNVLHPLLCLEGKLKCLQSLDQRGRQDEKHVRLSLLILKSLILTQLPVQPPRSLLKIVERIMNSALTDAGLNAWYRYEIMLESAIPLEQIQLMEIPQWQAFLSIRWQQLLVRCDEKRQKYETLMNRFESR
jgi:hypothetical protein